MNYNGLDDNITLCDSLKLLFCLSPVMYYEGKRTNRCNSVQPKPADWASDFYP